MTATKIFHFDAGSREIESPFVIDQECRACSCRHWIEALVPCIDMCGFGQMLQRILMRNDGGASRMHPCVAIGVIPVANAC